MSTRGTESPEETEIMKNFRIFYPFFNALNTDIHRIVIFKDAVFFFDNTLVKLG